MLNHATQDAGPQNKLQSLDIAKFGIKNLLISLIIYLIIYRSKTNVFYKQINNEASLQN